MVFQSVAEVISFFRGGFFCNQGTNNCEFDSRWASNASDWFGKKQASRSDGAETATCIGFCGGPPTTTRLRGGKERLQLSIDCKGP